MPTQIQIEVLSDRLDKVAKALYEADPKTCWPRRWGWTEMPEEKKNRYRAMAAAALSAG
jgi:hypothetical protein